MTILVITFQLQGLDDAGFRRLAEASAPRIAGVAGLLGKAYLAEPRTNTYGGVYVFADRRSAAAYLDSEIIGGLRVHPGIGDVTARLFGTVEHATRITQGRLPLVAPDLAA